MNLNDIVETQRAFDSAHGWSLKSGDPRELLTMLGNDLVGLLGEIGEFANVVKKLQRDQEGHDPHSVADQVADAKGQLAEELTDTFIYVARLAAHLGINLEVAFEQKLAINKVRYTGRQAPQTE